MIANFVLTGKLGVGWFLVLVPGQLDGLAIVFLFIFEVFPDSIKLLALTL